MTSYKSFRENLKKYIFSASGFRKIFALSGDEEDHSTIISTEDSITTALIAEVFSEIIKKRSGKTIAVGMDARPTGPAIAKCIISIFKNMNIDVFFSGITAAPEFMAWVKTTSIIDGFAYISASHNPIGHNGFKFGFADGAVLGGDESKNFISQINKIAGSEKSYKNAVNMISNKIDSLPKSSANKQLAEKAYYNFSNLVITGKETFEEQKKVFEIIKKTAKKIGIVGELNGSARGAGIDKKYFESFGIKTKMLNDKPGEIVHRIVPEGNSLDLCRRELEKAHAVDSSFILGYVPDNDGDRGNIVYFNEKTNNAKILEAQEVFALCVKSELEFLKQTNSVEKNAVVVNGPTSMRIETIATEYNAEVFRAEVGEANVVSLAAKKREEGYNVRILGEGSNGGNITHPSTVRDPLNTIFAIIKMLAITDYKSVSDAVDSLPLFTTTSAYEPEAKMNIGSISHAQLKANYEKIFPSSFEEKKVWLKNEFGINGWYEVNYEGILSKIGSGRELRSGNETGGLKIILTSNGREQAFLWMRGSGTEPVFRVMTDVAGDNPKAMKKLLLWQRELVAECVRMNN